VEPLQETPLKQYLTHPKGGTSMKKTSRFAALLLAAALVLSSCNSTKETPSQSNSNTPAEPAPATQPADPATPAPAEPAASNEEVEPITDLVLAKLASRELETFVAVQSQSATDAENLGLINEALVRSDAYGRKIPGITESWGTEDGGETWTFNLRHDVTWVDINGEVMAECNANDFATGLEFVLNFHKNGSANTSMPMELIKGAAEYYAWTKELTPEEGLKTDLSKFFEMVGMEVVDDYTIKYTCTGPRPYFDTVCGNHCMYPVSQALIDKLGGPEAYLASDNTNMWYNGAYIMTECILGNNKRFEPNPHYYDTECQRFDSITFRYVDSTDTAYTLYQNGEIDEVELTESALKTIAEDPDHPFHDQLVEKRPSSYSFQLHWNFAKMNEDGTPDTNWNTAVANKAFRQSFMYGLDLTEYLKRSNTINPLKCENVGYTMKDLIYTSDGTDYHQLVRDRLGLPDYNGETVVRYNKEKGDALKAQAMEELSAKGVTFPVHMAYYIQGANQTALDSATVLKNAISQSLGDDYVVLDIKTYVSSLSKEVRDPQLQSFVSNGWGADYNDPQNFLVQETYGNDGAWYSMNYSNIDQVTNEPELIAAYEEFTEMVNKANAIVDDMDARYNAYADAEAFLLENAFTVPLNYSISWALTHIDNYSYRGANLINVDTSKTAYTTEQYEQFQKDFAAGLK